MSALDARWPLTSPAWSVGVSPDAHAAYWRAALYSVAIAAALAPTASRDAQVAAGSVLAALGTHPPHERARVLAVLGAEGLVAPVVGALLGWAVQHRREELTHDALCRDPACARRRARP